MFNTVFFTVISGVLVYVTGQIFSKFFIEPIHAQKNTIGKISDALIYYSNLYTNPKSDNGFDRPEERKAGHLLFRNLACELTSKTHMIPCYKILSFLKIVRTRKNISEAHCKLIGLSNSMWIVSIDQVNLSLKFREELEKSLNLITQ